MAHHTLQRIELVLLRRITEDVRAQNWTAVAVDFVIVVVGVFIGIQVSNWNAVRAENVRSAQVLERIADDLSQDIAIYDDRVLFWRQVSEYGLSALADDDAAKIPSWELVLAYFQASQVAEFFPSNATFEELKSAGELGLIRDADLRKALGQYYAYPALDHLTQRPRYRERVRGIIPIDLQIYIWSNCHEMAEAVQRLKACPAPATSTDIERVSERLQSNETLHEELRYWVSSLEVALLIIGDSAEQARELRKRVLAGRGFTD